MPWSGRHVYSLPHTSWYTTTLTKPGVYRNLIELLASAGARMSDGRGARAIGQNLAAWT